MRLRSLSGLAAATAFALVACATGAPSSSSATAEAPPPGSAAGDDEASLSLAEHHRHHHHGGVEHFIALSLDTLGADPAKKADVEKIQAELEEKTAPAKAAEKALFTTLADGIASGTIDTAKVETAVAAVATAASGVHDASADSLNQLHAILSPTERQALVDKVEAHWAVWQRVNHEAEAGGAEKTGHLAHLTDELGLTPDQQSRISDALKSVLPATAAKFDPALADEHIKAFATAFASDNFDAKTLSGGGAANAHLATHGLTRLVLFYETVTPLLTPEQRNKLADSLREHLNHQHANAGKQS
jgi:Spy/CpxP family protein refolding chaperone